MFGFGKKKEQTEKIQKPELLEKKNIRLDCSPMAKKMIIRAVGQLLCDSGYVDEGYIEAMIKKGIVVPYQYRTELLSPMEWKRPRKRLSTPALR